MTISYLFWGFLAGAFLLAIYVGFIARGIGALERRIERAEEELHAGKPSSR